MTSPTLASRPLKFRAWDRNQMVLVHSLSWNDGGMIWHGPGNKMGWEWIDPTCTSWNETHNPKPSEHDVCPVMQWTGLVDKNGVKIWEGDIVRDTWRTNNPYGYSPDDWDDKDRTLVVSFSDGRFNLETETGDGGQYCVEGFSREVIGDVYTTRDLLKS